MTVSFLKEKQTGFYVMPDTEDLSYSVKRNEVVVLEAPDHVCEQRTYGFMFNKNVKEAIQAYFS